MYPDIFVFEARLVKIIPFRCYECNEAIELNATAVCTVCKHTFCLKHISLDMNGDRHVCKKCSTEKSGDFSSDSGRNY